MGITWMEEQDIVYEDGSGVIGVSVDLVSVGGGDRSLIRKRENTIVDFELKVYKGIFTTAVTATTLAHLLM